MAPQTDRGIPAAGWPEIILTETPGPLLEVDALIYPATLPRPWGEIIMTRLAEVNARWLFRLVVLDFNRQVHCHARTVEDTLRRLVWEAAGLKARRLGLDRFELLESCISAYRILGCLCQQAMRVQGAGSSPPTTLIFSLSQPAVRRHYQVALANLPSAKNP